MKTKNAGIKKLLEMKKLERLYGREREKSVKKFLARKIG